MSKRSRAGACCARIGRDTSRKGLVCGYPSTIDIARLYSTTQERENTCVKNSASLHRANEKNIDLKIDFREQRSGIAVELEKLAGQLTMETGALPVGDYWIGNKIIVERKTLNDFLVSIKKGFFTFKRVQHY